MAAPLSADRKKKIPVDKASGMSARTKRHFENVKRKMFAFVDQQQQIEGDANRLAPPPPLHFGPPRVFADQKGLKSRPRHGRSPMSRGKHLQTPLSLHKQLPHLALATPQVARRF